MIKARFATLLVAAALAIVCPALAEQEPSELEKASRLLEQVRGLEFKEPVEERVLDQTQLEAELSRLMDQEMSVEEEREMVTLLARLGLLPEEYDLRAGMLEMMVHQVAGFYEPKSGMMVTVPADEKMEEDVPSLIGVDRDAFNTIVLVHELDHALTDQHFDLEALFDTSEPISREDRMMARHALAEGDAMLAMILAQMKGIGAEMTREQFPIELMSAALAEMAKEDLVPGASDLPRYLQDQMLAPYLLGFDLVVRTWKDGGWEAVDAMWLDPPKSTEQLLHADCRDDAPQVVELPKKDRRARLAYDAEMGELGMRRWLELHLASEAASAAADGWDGDRIGLFRRKRKSKEHAVWDSVWDDAQQASEFAEAARAWFIKSQKTGEVEQDGVKVRIRL